VLKPTLYALAFQVPDMYSGQVRQALLQSAVGVVIAILLIATGIGCLFLFRLRRTKDLALLWIGIFLILYGVRDGDFLRIVSFLAQPVPVVFWVYLEATITHLIPVPFLLFLWEIFPTWRKVLRPVIWAQVPIVGFGIASDFILHRPYSFNRAHSGFTVILFVTFVIAVFTLSKSTLSTRSLRIGLIIFSVTVVAENLSNFSNIKLPFNPEPIGFAVFVLTLVSLVTSRAVESQERLVALDRELEIAREIQASILPLKLPHTDHLQIAARYLPMTAVAGDFYDVLVVDENKVGIIIADVSGHGVPAALIASMVKVAIAAQLPHADDPAKALAGINQTLCGKLTAQFVTAAYLFLDLANRTFRYAAAGHPAVFYRQATDNSIGAIEENGLPLGMIAVATYSFVERPLTAGSRFLLYTDGLLEASNSTGEFFGAQRIEAALSNSGTLNAEQAANELLERLRVWVGPKAVSQQEDDITVLVVDVL
jgi:sigma-B regulation protein RsbU (phosphoserine phosphatase)